MDSINLYDMRFKPGQQVVCIKGDDWLFNDDDTINHYGPKLHDIVTVDHYGPDDKNIVLREYLSKQNGYICSYNESEFEPLAEITEIHEILSAVPQTERG